MSITSAQSQLFGAKRRPLVIGLVNNMPDAALETTEQQFCAVLGAARAGNVIRLRLFSFPELVRSEKGRLYVTQHYEPIDSLWNGELDGLIVTGAEPRTASLRDEVYWGSLTKLVDWANESSTPTVWSCLAAHAAVLHLDGIERRRLAEKISGVFRCVKVGNDALVAGAPDCWHVPHSRLNTLDAEPLISAGYEIASLSDEAGVDAFTLRRRALFVFYQGHPEYDANALLREYRRDVGRYLAGTAEQYPELPRAYFDDDTARTFADFRARAQQQRRREVRAEFPEGGCCPQSVPVWHDLATRLYRNWLALVAEHRDEALVATTAPTLTIIPHLSPRTHQ